MLFISVKTLSYANLLLQGKNIPGDPALIQLQYRKESLLRNLYRAYLSHALLTFLLLLQQLSLPRYISSVAFCSYIFSQCLDGFTGNDLSTDRCLDGYFKLLPWYQLF